MGLLDSVIEAAKQQYQTTKRGFGLLASNPQQFAQEATTRYFPTKEEEAQFAQAQAAGGDYTQTPYYQKIMDLSQFQGSIKPTGLLQPVSSLTSIVDDAEKSGLKLDLYEKNGVINLSRIEVPKDMRGTGLGSDLMNKIINYADSTGSKVALSPSKDFGASSVNRLKDFYKNFGFIENKGKAKDFTTRETMYRNPQDQFQGSIKPTGLLNVPTAKQPQVNPQDESVRIYRGSYDTSPNYTVENNFKGRDAYGGVFGSGNLETAKGFGGDFVYFTDIPKPEILTNYHLNYNIPQKSVKEALLKAMPNINKKYFNDIYKIVVEDVGSDLRNVSDDVIDQFGKIDFGSANNEVQRLRGQVAKNLGYKAIEMLDETGTSYLVTPGAKFTKIENKKVDVPEARADWVRPAPIPGLVGRKRGMTK